MIELELFPLKMREASKSETFSGADEWENTKKAILASLDTLGGFTCYLDDITAIDGLKIDKRNEASEWHIRIIAGNENTTYTLYSSTVKDLALFLTGIIRIDHSKGQ